MAPIDAFPAGASHSLARGKRGGRRSWVVKGTSLLTLSLSGCSGRQSALEPAGRSAEWIATLFWGMTIGAFVIWGVMIALTFYAIRSQAGSKAAQQRRSQLLIVGGGVIFPTVVLGGLLAYGLAMLPPLLAHSPPGSLKIHVSGEQWWWRITYQPPEQAPVVAANEIRLPVGEPVEFELESPDVIHAFWIPSLGGKMDMIPGRKTRLALVPTRTGTFRGVCAEYCGDSHALMAFDVVVMERPDFDRWLEAQRQPVIEPAANPDNLITQGRAHFAATGCAACHTVQGTEARGVIGPDLTHVGSRLSVGAGVVENDRTGFERWLTETNRIKPGVLMPHFSMLPDSEVQALAAYLDSLQ